MSQFTFKKEAVLPASDPTSPFYINLPHHDAKPIDNLVNFFKYWKYFIKSLIHYLTEVAVVKEFEASLNYQLLNSIQFPGFKDLPRKVLLEIATAQQKEGNGGNAANSTGATTGQAYSATGTPNPTTPTKDLSKTVTNTGANLTITTPANEAKRPGLFKTKSNNSTFLKSSKNDGINSHKRSTSVNSTPSKPSQAAPTPVTHHATNDIKVPPHFFADDALFTNLPPLLLNHHQLTYQRSLKLFKDLSTKLIPRLDVLLKNLTTKIKEIKSSLKNEAFSNFHLAKEISETGRVLSEYMASVERYSSRVPVLKKELLGDQDGDGDGNNDDDDDDGVMDDPFLIKLRVDYQVKNQLINENYMYASYANLQNIAKELYVYISRELNSVADKFGKLELNPEFYKFMKEKISFSPTNDWEYFISMNPNFLNIYKTTAVQPKKEIRTFKTLTLPYADSIHNKCIRFGIMYKKSKLMKKYNRYFYVLTCNYLHEFRMETDEASTGGNILFKKNAASSKQKIGGFIGHDDVPVKSYNLNDCHIKIKDEKGFKFQLARNSNASKKYTLKCTNAAEFTTWYGDMEQLCKFGSKNYMRYELVQSKIQLNDMESQKVKEAKDQVKQGNEKQGPSSTQQASEVPTFRDSFKGGNGTPNKKDQFKLSFNNAGGESLSGIFTPSIRTPNPTSPSDGNPFDQTFMNGIAQHGNYSTNSLASSYNYSSPTFSPNEMNTAPEPNSAAQDLQHENYLMMQQQILKQQSEMLNLKIKELQSHSSGDLNKSISRSSSELSMTAREPSFTSTAAFSSVPGPGNLMSPKSGAKSLSSSTESMNSLVESEHSPSGVQAALDAHKQEMRKRSVIFELEQTPSPDAVPKREESRADIPTLLVSSNH